MYQPDPTIRSEGPAGAGYDRLLKAITAANPMTVLVDTYHAPGSQGFLARLREKWSQQVTWFDTRDALKDSETLTRRPALSWGPATTADGASSFPSASTFWTPIEGGDLSCQVHPDDAYINAHFREPCAQQETYYIMEATPEATVYLGMTEDTMSAWPPPSPGPSP